jgi:hypothetical protein
MIMRSSPISHQHGLNRLRQFHKFLELHFENKTNIRVIPKSILIRVPTRRIINLAKNYSENDLQTQDDCPYPLQSLKEASQSN